MHYAHISTSIVTGSSIVIESVFMFHGISFVQLILYIKNFQAGNINEKHSRTQQHFDDGLQHNAVPTNNRNTSRNIVSQD